MGGQPRVGLGEGRKEYMRKLPGWRMHVRTVAKHQSFSWPGNALLQNIGSRV